MQADLARLTISWLGNSRMLQLLLTLLPIALIDSIAPIRIGITVTMLGRQHPFVSAGTFILGLFVAYLALGLLIALGLNRVVDWLFPDNPLPSDFILGALIGVLLLVLGLRNLKSPHREKQVEEPKSTSLGAIFLLS